MKTIRVGLACLVATLMASITGLAQYYPGGGGMGGMGMGRGMGGNMSQSMTSTPRIPNIAGDMAMKETKWLKENLNLSKDQLKAVRNINNEYASQQQDALKDIIGTAERPTPEMRKAIQEMMLMLNEEKEDKIKPILTADQWNLYQSKKGDMQREIGGYRPPAPKNMQAKPDSASAVKQ